MENIAGCVDEEGNKFFAHMLSSVYSSEAEDGQDIEAAVYGQAAVESTVDIASARRRRPPDNGTEEATVKSLKSKAVKFVSGKTVQAKLEEATGTVSCAGGGNSMLGRSLLQQKTPARAPRDDDAIMELILQFEKLIDDAREQSQRTAGGAASSGKRSDSAEAKQDEPKEASTVSSPLPSSSVQSYASMVSAVRGEGSRLFDVDATPEASPHKDKDESSSRTYHQPSSLSRHEEQASDIVEENKSRSHRK
jgi:hypothetical protein